MTVFAKSSASQATQSGSSSTTSTVPDPPDYTACVEDQARRCSEDEEQGPALRHTAEEAVRDRVHLAARPGPRAAGRLEWLEGEATDQKIKVTPAEVTKSIDTQRKQQYPKQADFDKALKDAGFTMADLRFQTRLQQLPGRSAPRSPRAGGSDGQADLRLLREEQVQFGSAETRDLHIVLTKDKATAEKAKKAIQNGDSWSSVAKKYSTDEASKGQGGKLTVTKGNQEPAFDDAVFAGKKGELLGPIKTQFGYYVVDIDKITKATQQTLAQATPTIKQALTQQAQQKAVADFSETYRKKWTGDGLPQGLHHPGLQERPEGDDDRRDGRGATTPQQ